MDSQTMKITMFLGLAIILALVVFLALGVTKDFAFAFGGKFGLKGTEDEKTYVTNPSDVNVELRCERNEEQLKSGTFLYKINIKNTKLQSEGKDDIRPVLYFKSQILCTKDPAETSGKCTKKGIIPAETVKTGNLGGLNFELETVSLPTYTKEFYTLFLFKKTDKCENAIAGAISEQVLVSQCSRALLAKFDATTNSCPKLPNIKLETDASGNPVIQTRTAKDGTKGCSPVFKVINNDNFDWVGTDGYSILIRNCFPGKNPPDNDWWRPEMEDVPHLLGETTFIRSYEIAKGQSITQDAGAYCSARPEELTIELYKSCKNIKSTSATCYCVNHYQGIDNYKKGECKNWRDSPSYKNLDPPKPVDSVSFTCQP